MAIEKRNCEACDAEFTPHKKQPHKITCSKNCQQNYRHRKERGLPTKTQVLNCGVCGELFKQKRANNTGFCSKNCKNLSGSRKNSGLPVFGPRQYIKGSGSFTSQGYRMITRDHPNAKSRSKNGKGQILEHIFVMSNYLGRPLFDKETVHHKNGIRDDNRIENLELWSHSQPYGQRLEDKLKWCKEFLEQYGHTVIMIETT